MTRSWTLTIPSANTWISLLSLVNSDPSNNITPPDLTFAYVPFIPKVVHQFKCQSLNALSNAANGGAVISFSFDSKNESGIDLLSGSWDIMTSQNNDIILDQISVRSTNAGAKINVTITVN